MKIIVEAELPMEAAAYWEERDTPAFRAFQCQYLDLKSIEQTDLWEENGTTFRRLRTVPNQDLPAFLKKMLGDKGLVFDDVLEYAPTTPPYYFKFSTIPPVFTESTSIGGSVTIEQISPTSCRQILNAEVNVNVFGVGSIVEKVISSSLKTTYSKLGDVVKDWIKVRDSRLRNIVSRATRLSTSHSISIASGEGSVGLSVAGTIVSGGDVHLNPFNQKSAAVSPSIPTRRTTYGSLAPVGNGGDRFSTVSFISDSFTSGAEMCSRSSSIVASSVYEDAMEEQRDDSGRVIDSSNRVAAQRLRGLSLQWNREFALAISVENTNARRDSLYYDAFEEWTPIVSEGELDDDTGLISGRVQHQSKGGCCYRKKRRRRLTFQAGISVA